MANRKIDYTRFTDAQLEAARVLANPEEKMTNAALAKQVGVSERTIYRWREDQDFIDLLNDLTDKYMDSHLPELYRSLLKGVRNGSAKMTELGLKRAKKLVDVKEVAGEVNINVMAIEGMSNNDLRKQIEELERKLSLQRPDVIDITAEVVGDDE